MFFVGFACGKAARRYLPQSVSTHHSEQYECQQCISTMHPNHLPSWWGRRNFPNKTLWYSSTFECRDSLECAEFDMIYHTVCQSHKKPAFKRKNKISHLALLVKWNSITLFTSNAPSQSVELRNDSGLSLMLTSVCWISSIDGVSLMTVNPLSASMSIVWWRFFTIHEDIDCNVR